MKQKIFYQKTVYSYFLFIMLLCGFSPNHVLAEIPINYQYNHTDKALFFTWQGDATVAQKQKNRGIVLSFSDPIIADASQERLNSSYFDSIDYGYDTIALIPTRGTELTVFPEKNQVKILISSRNTDETLGITLTKIRLQFERGHVGQALQHINILEKQHPKSLAVLELKADIKNRTGRWKEAIRIYDRILEQSSGRVDIQKAKDDIVLEHGRFADAEIENRDTGNDRTEFFTRLHGYTPINNLINIGLKLERNDLDADIVQFPNNGATGATDDDFYRGEAYLEFIQDNNNTTRISAYAGEGNLGVGGVYTLLDNYGSTEFGIEVNVPNWDFVEGVIAEGTRDRVYIGRNIFFTPRFEADARIGLNQYSVDTASNVASSTSLDANFVYTLPSSHRVASFLGRDAVLSIRYALDAEYTEDVDQKTGVNGVFFPVPVTSREVHILALSVGKQIAEPLWWEIFGGYAVDRLGEDGINYGSGLYYDITKKTQLRLNYTHSVSTERTSETLDTIIAGVHTKF